MNKGTNFPAGGESDPHGSNEALEQAFQRFEALRADGMDQAEAVATVACELDAADAVSFEIGAGLMSVSIPGPDIEFANRLERQLRDAASGAIPLRRTPEARRPSRRTYVATAMAACVLLIAGLAAGSARSLPGESLYKVKTAAESARLGLSSEKNAARYHIVLADRRFGEADRLIERSRDESLALSGPGYYAASAAVSDPGLSALIQKTLQEARSNLQEASTVLIRARDTQGLARVVAVAHRGQKVVATATAVLGRERTQLVLVETEASLKLIERVAQQARDQIATEDEATPSPCATPTPTPIVTPTPAATPGVTPGVTPTPSPTPTATPVPAGTPTPQPATPTPVPTPSPTPCISPTPTAVPTASPTPSATVKPTPRPTPAASTRPQGTPAATPGRSQPPATPAPSDEPATSNTSSDAVRSCSWVDRILVRC